MSDQITMNVSKKTNIKLSKPSDCYQTVLVENSSIGYDNVNATSMNFINGNNDSIRTEKYIVTNSALPSFSGAAVVSQRMHVSSDSDSSVSHSKMPVSELQELCLTRNLSSPEYSVVRTEGPSHSPVFTVRAVVGGGLISCEATGKTKKCAKHTAAANALDELRKHPKMVAPDLTESINNQFEKLTISSDVRAGNSHSEGSIDSYDSCTNNSVNNPIGLVQEICAKNNLNLPVYQNSAPTGPSHDPIFCVTCKVMFDNEEIVVRGTGRTKQVAKRVAAEEALKCLSLKELSANTTTNRNKSKSKSHSTNSNNSNSNNNNNCEKNEMMEFFESLEAELLDSLDELFERNNANKNYCLHLERIAQRLDCTVDYIEFCGDISKSKKLKCLLQFKKISPKCDNTISIFTSWGHSYENIERAKQNAARKAIIMVKVLKME